MGRSGSVEHRKPVFAGGALMRLHQSVDAGGVHEREPLEVDHDHPRVRRLDLDHRGSEGGGGDQIELTDERQDHDLVDVIDPAPHYGRLTEPFRVLGMRCGLGVARRPFLIREGHRSAVPSKRRQRSVRVSRVYVGHVPPPARNGHDPNHHGCLDVPRACVDRGLVGRLATEPGAAGTRSPAPATAIKLVRDHHTASCVSGALREHLNGHQPPPVLPAAWEASFRRHR